jgi:4a-hydroxytetrahydrobiopterin dehydratase
MPMKPSSARKKISRSQARNAALLNQLGTPGLGSLLAGRRVAGALQLLVFLAGFFLFCFWAARNLEQYYRMAFHSAPNEPTGVGWMAWTGVGICVLAWIWSLQTSFSLLREASKVSLESLESFAAGQVRMEPAKIILALSALPQWQRHGEIISRTFEFKDFPAAMKFVNDVAELAEQAQHHPDIDIRWNKVALALTTHDAGGLTEKDFELARQCDALSVQ